jgi:hypothetical protein
MRQHTNASQYRTGTRWGPGLFSILLIGVLLSEVLLSGCSPSSRSARLGVEVETEHSCEDSRYITMTNLHSGNVSLKGWTISNEHATYVLPDIVLAPGGRVNIWSGPGTDDAHNIYIGRSVDTWAVRNASLRVSSPRPLLFGTGSIHFLGCQVEVPMPALVTVVPLEEEGSP